MLLKMYQNILALPYQINAVVNDRYAKFYDEYCYEFDEFILQLQVYNNYPLLRSKAYLPIAFNDLRTNEPLDGLIFSNADK
jgi:hypothetical protein